MRLATIKVNGTEKAGIVLNRGILPIKALNAAKGTAWAEDMMSLIQKQQIPGLTKWYNEGGKEELENMTSSSKKSERKAPYRQERRPARRPSPAPQKTETADDDDFDYDKYLSGIDRKQDPNESEIDDILNEYGH